MGVIIDSITQCRFASLEEVRQAARPGLEWFEHVMGAINDGIWDWDIATGKTYCNQAYFRMLGYEPAETVTTQDGWLDLVHPGDLQAAWEANQDCIEGVTPGFEIEFRMRHADGSWRWIKSRGKCTERGMDGRALHIVGTHTDISEVKRGEMIQAALYQISEAAHSVADLDELYPRIHMIIGGLMEASNFYIALYDEAAGLVSFPYCVDELDPTPPPQKLGRGMTEYVLRSGQPLLASPEVYSHLIETGAIQIVGAPSVDWLGVPLKTPDGKTFGMMALQTYTQQVRYTQSDQDVLVFISAQVASAILRKRAGEQIHKLNHTLHSISQVNQILVRAADENELMQRVCQALVDTAQYPLAWIGLYQHDIERTVRPAVIAGNDRGMLAGARLTWGENSTHPRQTGSLARSGEPVLRQHLVSTQPRTAYDEIAISCGYTASITLPLIAGGKPFGAAYVYAASDAFNAEEVALLSQMADDLAFGITAQRERVQHRQIVKALTESEEKYRSVVERANDGITILQKMKVVYANPSLAEMWGGKLEELLGRPFSDFVSPRMLDDMLDKYRRRKAGEIVPSTYITILQRKDGSEIPAEVNSASLYFQGADSEMVIVRDITERKQAEIERTQRLAELEAVNRISTALRTAENLEVMLPRLLDETLAVMNTDTGAIWLHDEVDGDLIPVAARGWLTTMSLYPQKDNEGVGGLVFTTGEVYVSSDFSQDPQTRPVVRNLVPPGEGGVCVPIYSTTERVGVFYVGVSSPRVLETGEIHLLMNLAEIAGNAIHRMRLHSQAVLHVQRLSALRIFDSTITSSLDLRLTLEVLIEQVTTQLGVDAADVLLINENSKTLDYAAGKGFHLVGAALRPRVRVGEGLAGKAVRERKMVQVCNPSQVAGSGAQGWLAQKERFKTYYGIPLISKGKIEGVLELFHRESLDPDPEWLEFLETIAGQAAVAIDDAQMFQSLQRSNAELTLAYDLFIEGLSHTLELRHHETQGHSQRVTALTLDLAREMNLTGDDELVSIRRGALLHDIGKICVPDSILLKPGKLTPDEWEVMRKHPDYAYDMLAPIGYLGPAVEIPYCHHEKWDGSGYPRGLAGKEIPLSARIFAIIDVWDALTNKRVYQDAWPRADVRAYIARQSGIHFDPQVVEAFLRYIDAAAAEGRSSGEDL